jgi:hypothetical protein
MSAFDKTSGVSMIDPVAITHPGYISGAELDVATKISISIDMFLGRVEATADTDPGTFYILKNLNESGDDGWTEIYSFTPIADTAETETLNATANSGQKVITVDSTTGFSVGDKVYIQDTGAIANSEYHIIDSIDTNVSITLRENLRVTKNDDDVIWNAADWLSASNIDLSAIKRIKAIYNHRGAPAANVEIKVVATVCNSIG